MKQTFKIDAGPSTFLIDSLLNTKVSYPEALGELVDNSYDQAAKTVRIALDGESVSVIDDGNGCDDLPAMLKLGQHARTKTTKLGRYGVGLKNVATGLGELLEICTRKGGVERCARIHWPTLRDSGSWTSVTGTEEESAKPNGTEITISQLHTNRFQLERIIKSLGFTFAPALWSGRRIVIDRDNETLPVEAWKLPEMQSYVEGGESKDGIGFTVRAGLVERNSEGPFILSFQHRIIGATTEPCGALSASERFMAFVELQGKWPMLRHKDGIKESLEAEWLYESLHQICFPLLRKVHQEGETVLLDELAAYLELNLGPIIGRPRRPNPGTKSGTIEPAGSDRSVSEAETVNTEIVHIVEERESTNRKKGFNIRYQDMDSNDVGRVDVNKKRVEIALNQNHTCVAECRRVNNKVLLKSICMALLASHQSLADESQMAFNFENENSAERFMSSFSLMMKVLAERDLLKSEAA